MENTNKHQLSEFSTKKSETSIISQLPKIGYLTGSLRAISKIMKNISIYDNTYDYDDDNSPIQESSLNIIKESFKGVEFETFFNYIRGIDKTQPLVIDFTEDRVLEELPVNDLPIVSKMLPKLVSNKCDIHLTFDKQILIRLYCKANNINFFEYAGMYSIKDSNSKVIKCFTVVFDKEYNKYVDGYQFTSGYAIKRYLKHKLLMFPIVGESDVKDITNYPIDQVTLREFIEDIFMSGDYKKEYIRDDFMK